MADIVIRNVPLEVRRIILKEQLKERMNRGQQYSMSSAIIKIIREWEVCYNSQKEKK